MKDNYNADSIKSLLAAHIRKHELIHSNIGDIKINNREPIGQGGNAVVYDASIGETEIAIKFLVNIGSDEKKRRFQSEYLNIAYYSERLPGTVRYMHYDILKLDIAEDKDNSISIPYIIMKKFICNLTKYRNEISKIDIEEIKKLFYQLLNIISNMESCNIVHRDLKPENILIDENNNYIIADFGIAHFSESAPIQGLTKKAERLANFTFSAPEQLQSGKKVSYFTDLYSFALIVYWFVFGDIAKGTNIKKLYDKYHTKEAVIMDRIISWCLNVNSLDRPQSVDEIKSKIETLKKEDDKVNPFDNIKVLRNAVVSAVPEMFNNIYFTNKSEYIDDLITKISESNDSLNLDMKYWFNTGTENDKIEEFRKYKDNQYIINKRLIKIVGVWGSLSMNEDDDILLFQFENMPNFIIEDGEYKGEYNKIAIINGDYICPEHLTDSGFIRYCGSVVPVNDLKIETLYVETESDEHYFAVGTWCQDTIYSKNDKYLQALHQYDCLTMEMIRKYKMTIKNNKSPHIYNFL